MKKAYVGGARRDGHGTVEMALVLGVFLLIVFGICEYGRFVMTHQMLEHAAREGARYAVVHTYDKTTAQVQDHVDALLAGQGWQLADYNKTSSIEVFKADATTGDNIGAWTSAAFGDNIGVRISGSYQPILPVYLFMPSVMQVKGECIMKSEAN